MRREEALKVLREHKRGFEERYGVTRLGIFGSVARDEAAGESDVDVVVEMAPDLFGRVSLKDELETILGAKVDLALLAAYESLPEKTHRQGGILCMMRRYFRKSWNSPAARSPFHLTDDGRTWIQVQRG